MPKFTFTPEEIGIFIQTKENNPEEIRYIAVGKMEDNGLTGTIFGYVGGGSFDDGFALNGEEMSFPEEDEDGDYFDYDMQAGTFSDETSREFFEACENMALEYVSYGGEGGPEPTEKMKNAKRVEPNVIMAGAEIEPVGFGLTSWKKTLA